MRNPQSVQSRRTDAIIGGQPGHEHVADAPVDESPVESRRAVFDVVEESGIAVDFWIGSFLYDNYSSFLILNLQLRMNKKKLLKEPHETGVYRTRDSYFVLQID